MKIVALSDIHSDINKLYSPQNFSEEFSKVLGQIESCDLVVCAGDVSPDLNEIMYTLNLIVESIESRFYVFVPGNHDVWETREEVTEGISRKKYETILPKIVNEASFIYLPKQPIVVDEEVAVIGTNGWYDYSFRNPKWDTYLKEHGTWYDPKYLDGKMWMDVEYANWGMSDKEVVEYMLTQLESDFAKVNGVPRKIVVSHHVPFREGVVYRDEVRWDYFSAFMGAARFGELFEKWGVELVIHGHTHFPLKYTAGNCRVICAPIGYQMEWVNDTTYDALRNRISVLQI